MPTTLRRGFGYKEATEAGIPWPMIRRSDFASVQDFNAAKRRAEKQRADLTDLLKKHPNLLARAKALSGSETPEKVIIKLREEASRYERERQALRNARDTG